MDALTHFLEMGGYARYVWPAYAVAALVLVGMLVESLAIARRNRRVLDALDRARPRMRRR